MRRKYGSNEYIGWIVLFTIFQSMPALAQRRPPGPMAAGQKQTRVQASAQFNQLAQQASDARSAEKLDEAITFYIKALKLRPSWSEGWWSLGTILYELDRYTEGQEVFGRLTTIEPKLGAAWAMLGLCDFQLKQYPQALSHLRRGRSFGIGGSEELSKVARYHEAILLNQLEQYEAAYDALSKIPFQETESPDLILALGLTMLRMPYFPSEAPPEKREMIFKAGRSAQLAILNRPGEALQIMKDLSTENPNTPGVHYAYGVMLLRDTPDAGIEELRRVLQLSPNDVAARLQIAFECIKRREHANGLSYAEEAVKLAPGLFAAHNALGRILLETGDVPGAVKELEISVRLAPDSPEMHFALARAYMRAGRAQDAARARAEFSRLDKIRSARREGAAPENKPEEKRQK